MGKHDKRLIEALGVGDDAVAGVLAVEALDCIRRVEDDILDMDGLADDIRAVLESAGRAGGPTAVAAEIAEALAYDYHLCRREDVTEPIRPAARPPIGHHQV